MKKEIEIERKFLLKDKSIIKSADYSYDIVQFYLTDNLRFRKDKDGFRFELKRRKQNFNIEKSLILNEKIGGIIFSLLNFLIKRKIHKKRHIINFNNFKYEIDEFISHDIFLVEIEFKTLYKMYHFLSMEKPIWLGSDVTDNPNYFNSNISKI